MVVWRFQVSPRRIAGTGESALVRTLADFGVHSVQSVVTSQVYLIEASDDRSVADRIGTGLLVDPVTESCKAMKEGVQTVDSPDSLVIEVHPKPGVMDNAAQSALLELRGMEIPVQSVRTARRYELTPMPADRDIPRISRLFGNSCIEDVFIGTPPIRPPPTPPTYQFKLVRVPIRDLDAAGLDRLSRDGHLFLSRDEMASIQGHYRGLERDPTDIELETLAQTWSEHCVHKTLRSAFDYRGAPFPTASPVNRRASTEGGETVVGYDNLLRDTIAKATHELMEEGRGPECLSVFVDNAGVIAFDETFGLAFKVETHNHPSAIEPYGGASTGVGGVIRDVLGCGLGAQPIANTDVFCVAPPDWPIDQVPRGVIHPRSVLRGIVSGVRDYGNRMGIPTVNGAVHFDPRYLGNPLVYCGCVGLIRRDRISKSARPGDAIVVIGGRTGRDGIHGATFSSAELTDSHDDEFAHAVQIGNAIEEKKVLDLILLAGGYSSTDIGSDAPSCLFTAVTDCGAGGLSSAIGEMGAETGADVQLEKVPLKYAGLRYDEIWISEAQERMVLAVPEANLDAFLTLARSESVDAAVIGRFTDTHRLIVRYGEVVVGDIRMAFLHEGLPRTRRSATWMPPAPPGDVRRAAFAMDADAALSPMEAARRFRECLSRPTVASKHWIYRQYDHEVRAGSVVKPWCGPGEGPTDAAVIRPRLDSNRGAAIGCGMATHLADVDPYWMAIAAIDEAVRNVVCVGGDPRRTAILDNFCWPSAGDSASLGALVRACQACYDAAKAYGLPFISGKDSLNNVFAATEQDAAMILDVIRERYPADAGLISEQMRRLHHRLSIPYSLLISALARVDDVNRSIQPLPSFAGADEAVLFYVGTRSMRWEDVSLATLATLHSSMSDLIARGDIVAAHDVSDGGIAVAVGEMAMARTCQTVYLRAADLPTADPFAEPPSAYVVQCRTGVVLDELIRLDGIVVVPTARLRAVDADEFFAFVESSRDDAAMPIDWESVGGSPGAVHDFRAVWRAPLDW